MKNRSAQTVSEILKALKIVAVIRGENETEAYDFAVAAYEGNFRAIEMTATTPNYLSLISNFKQNYSDSLVGLGTVLSKEVAYSAIKCGVDFIVSPCYVEEVAKLCFKKNVLYIPGCFSATEIFNATQKYFHPVVKLFPADSLGDNFIKSLKVVLPNVAFLPTGAVTYENMQNYFKSGADILAFGSSLTASKSSAKIKQLAKKIFARA